MDVPRSEWRGVNLPVRLAWSRVGMDVLCGIRSAHPKSNIGREDLFGKAGELAPGPPTDRLSGDRGGNRQSNDELKRRTQGKRRGERKRSARGMTFQ